MTISAPKHFDAIASQYATSEVHANSPTIRRLHELLATKQPDSVCDVACGPGHLTLSFAGKASRIVGVDAAPNMLRQFERLAKERGVKVETVLAYAETVPFPPIPSTRLFRDWHRIIFQTPPRRFRKWRVWRRSAAVWP